MAYLIIQTRAIFGDNIGNLAVRIRVNPDLVESVLGIIVYILGTKLFRNIAEGLVFPAAQVQVSPSGV